jgi:hypothetical protein
MLFDGRFWPISEVATCRFEVCSGEASGPELLKSSVSPLTRSGLGAFSRFCLQCLWPFGQDKYPSRDSL